MTRRLLGLVLAGLALVVVVTGGGGLAAESLAAFELLSLVAALVAASLPARQGPRGAATVGVVLVGFTGLSAATSAFPFASVDRWAAWSSALLLAWAVGRLERSCPDVARGRRDTGLLLTLGGAVALGLQLLAELGLPLRGPIEASGGARRVGSFANPNHLSELLVLIAAGSLPFVGLRTWTARFATAVALACSLGVVLGASRIAPAALLTGLLAWLWTQRLASRAIRPSRWIAGLLAALVVAVAGARLVVVRFAEEDAWTRPRIWAAVAPAALERPLLGLGPGAFAHAHHAYNFPVDERIGRFAKRPSTPHGEWLRLPIELGFAGCALLVLAIALRLAAAPSRPRLLGALPLLAALAPLALVHELFHAPALAAWTAVAFVAATERRRDGDEGSGPLLSDERPGRLLALAVLLAAAVAGLVLRPTLADRAARAGRVRQALALNPHHAGYWLAAGRASAAGPPAPAALAAAVISFEEAERISRRSPDGSRERARALALATSRFVPEEASREAAAAAWDEASRRSPTDAFLLAEQASFLLQTGAPARAAVLAEEALLLEPRFVDAALLALLSVRAAEGEGPHAFELERARALLGEAPGLSREATNDYELRLLKADPRLLEGAGFLTGE